jgi:hypothetical protein
MYMVGKGTAVALGQSGRGVKGRRYRANNMASGRRQSVRDVDIYRRAYPAPELTTSSVHICLHLERELD